MRKVSAKKSLPMVFCSIPITDWIANSLCLRTSIYLLTNRTRNRISRVIPQTAVFIPPPTRVKSYALPISGL